MPAPNEVSGATDLLKAVGDPTRMRLLPALSMNPSAVSHQLRVLRGAHLVKYRREDVYYSVADDHLQDLLRVSLEHIRHSQNP